MYPQCLDSTWNMVDSQIGVESLMENEWMTRIMESLDWKGLWSHLMPTPIPSLTDSDIHNGQEELHRSWSQWACTWENWTCMPEGKWGKGPVGPEDINTQPHALVFLRGYAGEAAGRLQCSIYSSAAQSDMDWSYHIPTYYWPLSTCQA